MKRLAIPLLATMLVPAAAPGVFAHTGLLKSEPAAGAHVHEVGTITLHFSAPLQPALSGARLIGPSGRELPVATAVGMTAITLLPFQLKPGRYQVQWHSVGQDQSRDKGNIGFTVTP